MTNPFDPSRHAWRTVTGPEDGCRLYEILDDDGKLIVDVTIASLVADWKANT